MALDGIRIHWRVAAAKSPIRPGQIWTKAGKHICQVYLHVLLNFFGGRRGFHNKKSYPFLFVLNKVNVYNYLYNLKPTRRKKTKYKNYYYNYVSYKYISILRKNCNTCSLYHKLYVLVCRCQNTVLHEIGSIHKMFILADSTKNCSCFRMQIT